jgi:hypothetical protein
VARLSFLTIRAMSNEHSTEHLQDAWQGQHVPPFHMSLDEIKNRTKKFDKEIRIRNVSFYAFAFS